MRGPTRSFTASKVAAWTAIDRWIAADRLLNLDEDKAPWEQLRDQIRDEICDKGFDAKRNTFTQYYGSKNVDASLLFIPLSGFLPATDPRVVGTVKAIEEELIEDGLVLRYRTDASDDGLVARRACSSRARSGSRTTYQLMGRHDDARKLFERVGGPAQRRRPARRGVPDRREAADRQLPAGVQPPRARQRGLHAELGTALALTSAAGWRACHGPRA